MPVCIPDNLIEKDCVINIGDLTIKVITVPGHTDGSVLYYLEKDDEKWLFTGDMFCCEGEKGDIAAAISPFSPSQQNMSPVNSHFSSSFSR